MSKSFNPIEEGKTEGDLTKRILRSISDVVRILDDKRSRAQAVVDLFSATIEVNRSKLHELSYRLILIDPQGYGKRGEETLWKKGYHDVFVTARQLKSGENWNEAEAALVRGLLLSGLGHYQHLILRLQADYSLHIEGFADFSLVIADYGISKGKAFEIFSAYYEYLLGKNSANRLEEAAWADALVGRCLLCLGDLSRYMREIEPGWSVGMAERFYLQAALLDQKQGRPFNQLGTLSGNRYHALDSVYYYMRSLSCVEAFQGAAGNLVKTLENNLTKLQMENFGTLVTKPVQQVIIRFLALVNTWYWGKTITNTSSFISEMCQGFQRVLPKGVAAIDKTAFNWDLPFLLPPEAEERLPLDVTVKMAAILFMCWEKTKTDLPQQAEITFTLLSMFDSILQHLSNRCEKFKSDRKKHRRRRRRRRCSDESSDSEASVEQSIASGDSEDSPDVSSAEEGDEIHNGHCNGVNGKSSNSTLSWLEDETLAVLNVLCLWFRYHGENLSANNSKAVLGNLVMILNELSLAVIVKYDGLKNSKIPTIEDTCLRGLPGLEKSQLFLDWSLSCRRLSLQEVSVLRACRVLQHAEHLPGISMNSASKKYQLVEIIHSASPVDIINAEEDKGKLMKNMGQLWLKAEVKELENRVRKTTNDYSPYLVVDAEALIEHMPLVRQLVGSRQFIVVIPIVVIAQLDECKKESGRARETIRWLEGQFQYGNRHLRSQKAQELCSLGVIKYPKKKDKEAWNFFQIMECCSYLKKQSELRCKKTGNVIFLTGVKDRSILGNGGVAFDFSPSGLASTFGVTLEHVETFHSKWKLSSKSHG